MNNPPPPNLVISACAGSGKTYALIQRLLRLLKEGVPPGEILAITFTRKAAAEIETRLLDQLQQQAAAGEEWAARCLRRLLFAEQAADEFNIYTFHGWFNVLLAGRSWSPEWYGPAEISEDDKPLCAEAWRRWLAKTRQRDALATVLAQCSPTALQQLLSESLVHHLNAWRQNPTPLPPPPDEAQAAEQLRRAMHAFADAKQESGSDYSKAQQAARAYVDSSNDDTLHDLETAFLTTTGTPRRRLLTSAEKVGSEQILAAAYDALENQLTVAATLRTLAFHRQVAALAQEYLQELAAVKVERDQVSFNDLEYMSYQAVREHGDVNALLYRLNRRFRHILVDEFQDTSPLQWQIIACWLQAAHGSEDAPSLFIVGDDKQAIYRFRYGDARLFAEAREFLATHYPCEQEENNCCRRLTPPLIDFVNAVFPALLPAFPVHQVSEQNRDLPGRVEWHELPAASAPPVPRCVRNPLHSALPDNDRRLHWAQTVAEKIKSIIGNWVIHDNGTPRHVAAEDVLLLLPTSTHAPYLRQALQRQGLVFSSRGEGIASSLACRDMVALLTALQSPHNRLSLMQALKSPLFGLSEDILARLAQTAEGSIWDNLQNDDALAEVAEKLRRWREWVLAGTLPVHDLLVKVFADGEVFARYRAAVPPACRQQVVADLAALLDFSLAHAGGRQPLLPQFLRVVGDAAAVESGGGIRLMSVHAAKGLESPVVVLADCSFDRKYSGGDKQSVDILVDWPPAESEPRHFIFRPTREKRAFADLVENERAHAEREFNNLFYVALTRARQALVVFSFEDVEHARLDALRSTMTQNGSEQDGMWVLGDDLTRITPAASPTAPPAPAAAPPPPTKTGEAMDNERVKAAALGERLHQQVALLLQGVDDDTIAAVTDAASLPTAKQLLQNHELQALLKDSERHEVEAEFIHAGKLLRMDLLIFNKKEIWVIDYKTGAGALQRYQQQMDEYRAAVSAVHPGQTVRAAFVTPRGFQPCDEPQ